MHTIFISYRREDSQAVADRINDALIAEYGVEIVFYDTTSIAYGSDFIKQINLVIAACKVMLVVIGKEWMTITDERGNLRIKNKDDTVRAEIELALTKGLFILPILVNGAVMPHTKNLPLPIKSLASINGITVRNGKDFTRDINDLKAAISGYVQPPEEATPHLTNNSNTKKVYNFKKIYAIVGLALVSILLVLYFLSPISKKLLSDTNLPPATGNDSTAILNSDITPSANTYPLELGSSGDAVLQLQKKLESLGFYSGAVDGAFGLSTQVTVKKFQRSKGQTPDGIVGVKTLRSLSLAPLQTNINSSSSNQQGQALPGDSTIESK